MSTFNLFSFVLFDEIYEPFNFHSLFNSGFFKHTHLKNRMYKNIVFLIK